MSEQRLKRQLLKKKLFAKNRLVILNEDTFAEIFSLRLTLMNVFVFASLGAVITGVTILIAFTPLREYIPGYPSGKLKREATELALKSDSLSNALKKNQIYLQSVVKVLNGDLEYEKVNKDSILASTKEVLKIENASPSKAEIELRKEIDAEEKSAKQNKTSRNKH